MEVGRHSRDIVTPLYPVDLTIEAGPMVSLDTVLSYEKDGRYFVGQALTEDLPHVFELVPSKETKLELILPTNDNKPN
jgi:hypothetical protein